MGIIATGRAETTAFRTQMLLQGLDIETATNGGLRLTAKAPTAYSIVKREFGFKGNRQNVLNQFVEYLDTSDDIRAVNFREFMSVKRNPKPITAYARNYNPPKAKRA